MSLLSAASIGAGSTLFLWGVWLSNIHDAQHDLVSDGHVSGQPIHMLITFRIKPTHTQTDILAWQLGVLVAALDPRKNRRNDAVACNACNALLLSVHVNLDRSHKM